MVFKVSYDRDWGLRHPRRPLVDLYFTHKPSKQEILQAFALEGHRIYKRFEEPRCSGMVEIKEIIFVS